jgi:hypothetical protein
VRLAPAITSRIPTARKPLSKNNLEAVERILVLVSAVSARDFRILPSKAIYFCRF